ncbi:MAG: hypothetical protein NT019_02860 [Candidatus Adlerbacteria bacterium]|nr:hypothetical protein [Candidatus Adlerbacteria bacterium]
MEHIGAHIKLFPQKKEAPAAKPLKITERGEMMEYFLKKLNQARVRDGLAPMTMGRMARLLVAIPTEDLYYLKSICDQATDFSKKFWWEIHPKNHTPQAIAESQKKFKKTYAR